MESIQATKQRFGIIGNDAKLNRAIEKAIQVAPTDISVLVIVESGVGKESIPKIIHQLSHRKHGKYIAVNCGAIPEGTIDSELFGHEKGAFTGATEKRIGKFSEADGGTLFLDEISELPLDAQVKLLRAIQEGEIDPVGGKRPHNVDIRLISATNRDLTECVRAGQFREDLYYRLGVFPILIPPLRSRREDIPLLARHFMTRFAAEESKPVRAIAPDAMLALQSHDWPGNVRQLENTLFRAIVLCEGDCLQLSDFPQLGAVSAAAPQAPAQQPASAGSTVTAQQTVPVQLPQSEPVSRWHIPALGDDGQLRTMEEMEAEMLRVALERYEGRMSEIARRLGIGRSTLYRRVRDLGLDSAA